MLQGAAPFDGQEVYKSLAVTKPCTLRFHGCFTDGGLDEQLAMYWASEYKFLLFRGLLSGLMMTCCVYAGGSYVHSKPLGKLLQRMW